jgi:hypothetical protein
MNNFMKSILFCALLLLSFAGFTHEEPAKTLFERNAKIAQKKLYASLQVKTVRVFRIDKEMNRTKLVMMGYDTDGTYLYLQSYKNDSLELRVEYGYSKQGDMTTDTDYNPAGKMIEKNMFKYDKQGRVIGGKSYDKRKLSATFQFVHADNKKSIEFLKFQPRKELEYKLIYTYNNDFDTEDYASVVKLSRHGKQQLKVTKEYNNQGKVIKKIIYDADNKLMHSFRYTYDNSGNNTGIERINNDGELTRLDVFVYNEKGLITEQYATDKDENMISRLVYAYEFYE